MAVYSVDLPFQKKYFLRVVCIYISNSMA